MRQFLSPVPPDKNGIILVKGKDYRYLRQVLRLKAGDMLSVRSPDGELFNTTVCTTDVARRTVTLQVCGIHTASETNAAHRTAGRGVKASDIQNDVSASSNIEYWLFQFVPQPSKMELIVRQAVECGVKYIVPVAGEYSQKAGPEALKANRRQRLERIIREARQQSGSPVESCVTECFDLESALSLWKENCKNASVSNAAFALVERNGNCKGLQKLSKGGNGVPQKIAVAVGSEGGISPAEADSLVKAGFVPLHFAGNILRCETAALYGIAAVQSAVMQLEAQEEE